MLRISEAVSLALRATTLLARTPGRRISTLEFAAELDASRDHLAKVLNRLVRAGLLSSTRGPGGGFLLVRAPDEVRLLDIYECIEGELNPSYCVFTDGRSCAEANCILGDLPQNVSRQVLEYFTTHRLSDVLGLGTRISGPGCVR